jgi:hypothetical protein
MLTDVQISAAKAAKPYRYTGTQLHEHDDCVRIAYEWLDAQVKTKGVTQKTRPLKHIIENWAKRYVSRSDVEVAAHLHPDIRGRYPHFNISARFTKPNARRLAGIGEAGKHQTYDRYRDDETYARAEP